MQKLKRLYFFNLIRLIQLCERKNLTFIDCWDEIYSLILKNVINLAKGSLNNIFQNSFNKILSQQLTHDRPYISQRLAGWLYWGLTPL